MPLKPIGLIFKFIVCAASVCWRNQWATSAQEVCRFTQRCVISRSSVLYSGSGLLLHTAHIHSAVGKGCVFVTTLSRFPFRQQTLVCLRHSLMLSGPFLLIRNIMWLLFLLLSRNCAGEVYQQPRPDALITV